MRFWRYEKLPKCRIANKVIHPDEKAAAAHVAEMAADGCDVRKVIPYPCQHCAGWHVGHKSTRAQRRRFRRSQ